MLHLALPDDLIIFGSDTITFAVQIIKYPDFYVSLFVEVKQKNL
jgi:hypothetical protein